MHDLTLVARTAHAMLLRMRGDGEGALAEFLEILEIRREPGGDAIQLVMILSNLARLQLELQRADAAEAYLVEAASIGAERLGARHHETLVARSLLAQVFLQTSRSAEALVILEEVCAALHETLGPRHLRAIYADVSLAQARLATGDAERGVAGLTDALGRCEDLLGKAHENAVTMSCVLAMALRYLDRHDEAEEVLRTRIEACGPMPDEDPRAQALAAALARTHP